MEAHFINIDADLEAAKFFDDGMLNQAYNQYYIKRILRQTPKGLTKRDRYLYILENLFEGGMVELLSSHLDLYQITTNKWIYILDMSDTFDIISDACCFEYLIEDAIKLIHQKINDMDSNKVPVITLKKRLYGDKYKQFYDTIRAVLYRFEFHDDDIR